MSYLDSPPTTYPTRSISGTLSTASPLRGVTGGDSRDKGVQLPTQISAIVILPPVNIDTFRACPNTSTSQVSRRHLFTYMYWNYVCIYRPWKKLHMVFEFLKLVSLVNYKCHKGITCSILIHNRLERKTNFRKKKKIMLAKNNEFQQMKSIPVFS